MERPEWQNLDQVLDKTLTFSASELLELCSAFIKHTSVHRKELAEFFTCTFPMRKEPYTINDILGVDIRAVLITEWFGKRNNMSPTAFKKFVETYGFKLLPKDLKISVLVHDKDNPVDVAFQRTVSDNLDEFDCILHLINSFISVLADAALSLVTRYYERPEDFPVDPELGQGCRDDLAFYLNLYSSCMTNNKKFSSAVKDRYTSTGLFNTQERDKIASLFLWKGPELPVVKDNIIQSCLKDYTDDFAAWKDAVADTITAYTLIMLPKVRAFRKVIDITIINEEKEKLAALTNWLFFKIHECRNGLKELHENETDANVSQPDTYILCEEEHCEKFHERLLKEPGYRTAPGIRYLIDECNRHRELNKESLRKYFYLGPFKNQTPFARFLKENLRPYADVEAVFADEKSYKVFSDAYSRGLLRFFWDDAYMNRIKDVYTGLCDDVLKTDGAEVLFSESEEVVKIKFGALTDENLWPEEVLEYAYRPKHSDQNYKSVIRMLFGGREAVDVGGRSVSVHVIIFLLMYFYWTYISIDKITAEDVSNCTRCVFHKEIVM